MNNSRHILKSLITVALTTAAVNANAQFAPRLSSDDIEGAIMPAVPFPLNDGAARASLPPAQGRAPATMGLAPTSMGLAPTPAEDAEPARPQTRSRDTGRRPLSAQETADRLLR